MKAIFPFMLPTDIKIDLNQLFVMFAIKSSGTMRDGEIHICGGGSRARLRALEALAFFILNMHSPAFLSTL